MPFVLKNNAHTQSWQEQKITDRHSGCQRNFNFIINFHIYKGHSGTFMETATTPEMSLRCILFGWQEHLDAVVWQGVITTLVTGGEPPESWNLGALAWEKSCPVGFLQMTQRNPTASAERIKLCNFTFLAHDSQSSNRSKWSKNFGSDAKNNMPHSCGATSGNLLLGWSFFPV